MLLKIKTGEGKSMGNINKSINIASMSKGEDIIHDIIISNLSQKFFLKILRKKIKFNWMKEKRKNQKMVLEVKINQPEKRSYQHSLLLQILLKKKWKSLWNYQKKNNSYENDRNIINESLNFLNIL